MDKIMKKKRGMEIVTSLCCVPNYVQKNPFLLIYQLVNFGDLKVVSELF